MRRLLIFALLASCLPPGNYPLEDLAAPLGEGEGAEVRARASLDHAPSAGWDLVLDLDILAREGHRPLVDLSRVQVRSDEVRWTPCTLPSTAVVDALRTRLEDGERLRMTLTCVDVRRPEHHLEVRVPVSGTGGRGYVDLVFSGVR